MMSRTLFKRPYSLVVVVMVKMKQIRSDRAELAPCDILHKLSHYCRDYPTSMYHSVLQSPQNSVRNRDRNPSRLFQIQNWN